MASRYGTVSAASAASRTTGLALKAMPRPAAASMSMSLAPSPTAMVRASGTPAAAAKVASAAAFPARSTMAPGQLAGDDAPVHDELVGGQVVDAQLGDERADHLREAAAHHGQLVAESFQGAHQGPRARA